MKKSFLLFKERKIQNSGKSIFKKKSESGGPFISGWITHFFPYTKGHQTNSLIKNPILNRKADLKLDDFPRGLSRVPFKWEYHSQVFSMEFISGFIGITEDKETHVMEAEINWMILEPIKGKKGSKIGNSFQKFLRNFTGPDNQIYI